jgi:hypothetical protein
MTHRTGHSFPNSYLKTAGMTPESCGRLCSGLGYNYRGVEYGDQYFRGSHLPLSMDIATCDTPCAKHTSKKCGGTSILTSSLAVGRNGGGWDGSCSNGGDVAAAATTAMTAVAAAGVARVAVVQHPQ